MTSEESTYRMLVVANETCPCPALLERVAGQAGAHESHEVRIVAPALNSRLRHFVSDVDEAIAAARERLEAAIGDLRKQGVSVEGAVGDADPFTAVHDELERFQADAILLSTHPPEQSHWMEDGLLERVRDTVEVDVEHVVSIYGTTPS